MANLGGVTCEVKGRKSAQSTAKPLKRASQGLDPVTVVTIESMRVIPPLFMMHADRREHIKTFPAPDGEIFFMHSCNK